MKLIARSAICVWVAVAASIVGTMLIWKSGDFYPHPLWAATTILTVLGPLVQLALGAGWRCVRGPERLRAIGWLLIGATPVTSLAAYFTSLHVTTTTRSPVPRSSAVGLTVTWVTSYFDLEARFRYPRRTEGRRVVLIDAGQTPRAKELVADMDEYIEQTARELGGSVPEAPLYWVRGSLFGLGSRSIQCWALCATNVATGKLTSLDRHEMAHSLIAAMCGVGQDPPAVLCEGWAETRSADRDRQITALNERIEDGRTYSLLELIGPEWYDRHAGAAYGHGGPLVYYLIEHYGAKKFFELYSQVHRATFDADCRAILGDSWETIDLGFWPWVKSQAAAIAAAMPELPGTAPAVVQLSDDVAPYDWRAIVDGYRAANPPGINKKLPQHLAFVAEVEEMQEGAPAGGKKHHEFSALFDGGKLWIYENFYVLTDQFLMVTDRRSAMLISERGLAVSSRVNELQTADSVRAEAANLLNVYGLYGGSIYPFPWEEKPSSTAAWTIEKITRPVDGDENSGRWSVVCTYASQYDDPPTRLQVELDPKSRWWLTRMNVETPGKHYIKSRSEYQTLGGVLILMSSTFQLGPTPETNESGSQIHVRALNEVEQRQLRERVEAAIAAGPGPPYATLRRVVWATAVLCPLAGIGLLVIPLRKTPIVKAA